MRTKMRTFKVEVSSKLIKRQEIKEIKNEKS